MQLQKKSIVRMSISNRPLLFFILWMTILIALIYSTLRTELQVVIPTKNHPVVLYSNDLAHDLKWVYTQAINQAHHSIKLYIYGCTDANIIQRLNAKYRKGVDVQVCYDPSACSMSDALFPCYPISSKGLMHRKILTIDKHLVFIGTANLTSPSLNIHRNLLLAFESAELARFLDREMEESISCHLGNATLQCYLLPQAGEVALSQLIEVLDGAQQKIELALFTFTHPKLQEALIRAVSRGVSVSVYLDYFASVGSSRNAALSLVEHGIVVKQASSQWLLHYKCGFIDHTTLIFGSANWTRSAFNKNQEILAILSPLDKSHCKSIHRLMQTIAKKSQRL